MPATAGIIDFALHPPLGLLSSTLDTGGPFTGYGTRTTIAGSPVANTYGMLAVVSGTIPAGLGYYLGWPSDTGLFDGRVYEDRLFQVVVQHQLASGLWVTTQEVNSHKLGEIILWDVALPGRIGYWCLPYVSIDMYKLLV